MEKHPSASVKPVTQLGSIDGIEPLNSYDLFLSILFLFAKYLALFMAFDLYH
jgi:hypothetical protein